MYGNITWKSGDGVLAVAKLQMAIVTPGQDGVKEATAVNALLVQDIKTVKAEEQEYVALDAIQSVFNTAKFRCATQQEMEALHDKMAGIINALMDGIDCPAFDMLWDIWKTFGILWVAPRDADATKHFYELGGKQEKKYPTLAYLIYRELLNVLIRLPDFMERQDMVISLIEKLNTAGEDAMKYALQLSGDLFFYGLKEAVE